MDVRVDAFSNLWRVESWIRWGILPCAFSLHDGVLMRAFFGPGARRRARRWTAVQPWPKAGARHRR